MINERRLHKIKKTHFSLRSYEGSDSNQAEQHGWQEFPSNFTERNQFLLVQNDFCDSFQTIFFQDFDKRLKGGCLGELSICNCSWPPFRLPGAVTPVTPVNAPLVGLAPRVQEIWWLWENLWKFIGSRIGWVGTYILLTIDLRKPIFLFGVCKWAEWNIFFWEYHMCIYIYTCSIYVYIEHNTNCLLLGI